MRSGAKSYRRKGFLIYEEMRKYLTVYKEAAVVIHDFAPYPTEFPYILGKFSFLFYQCSKYSHCFNSPSL
jgi:hypothetical protein